MTRNQESAADRLEQLAQEHEGYRVKSLFGGRALYRGEILLVAAFEDAKKISPWNGVLVATSKEHHESLLKEFKNLKPHPVLGKWLYLPAHSANFTKTIDKILICILKQDSRIGVLSGQKHRDRAKRGDNIPILRARNLGPKSAEALALVGIQTLADLKRFGWEKILEKLWVRVPEFCNLNMARALIGAIENIDWREIPKTDLQLARSTLLQIKMGK